jgi:hypothetical protein
LNVTLKSEDVHEAFDKKKHVIHDFYEKDYELLEYPLP